MVCDVNSIDSNVTGLSIAEEECPKILPVVPGDVDWYTQEPNSYSNFGTVVNTVAREPINPLRQNKKGTTTSIEAAGGFNSDMTQNNMDRLLQGFFFNDAFEKYNLLPFNGTANPTLDVEVGNGIYNVTSTLATSIYASDLVKATGFASSANNGTFLVEAVTVAELDTDNTASVLDAAPAANANIRVVGHEFASGDLAATISSGTLVLTSAAKDISELGLRVGEWIFIGGDAVGTQFTNGTGYARVSALTTTTITCDKSTGLVTADTGAAKTIRIFFGTYQRNGTQLSEIIYRSYQLERTLGNDTVGVQSEIMIGAYANEFALKIPSEAKLEVDLSYIALDSEVRTGTQGLKAGNRISALAEEAYNTSTDVVRINMSPVTASLTPTPQFAFVTEANFNIANGVKLNKAVGVAGGIGVATGNFVVSGSVTAYFQTVAALSAVRNNVDITIDAIFAKSNGGMIFDVPLLILSSAGVNVTKDDPITIPLEQFAAENSFGYTFSYCNMHYLPTIAMPA